MDRKKTLTICGAILAAAAVLSLVIFSTEPTAQRVTATRETAMLVQVTEARAGDHRPTIVAMGTVEPAQDVILSPRVSGEIVERSPDFTPGGFVEKGEILLRIDPADYENALRQRRSELYRALSALSVEMGRQNVAEKDYQLLDEELSSEFEALVLRKPQLNAARAEVEAARASVDQAELELERTNLRAPFDAHILTRNVNVGSQVSPGENLGRIVGLETYWVATTVPMSKLPWLRFPHGEEEGSDVTIRNRVAWEAGVYRKGRIHRLVGALEDRTRMARVLVNVPDPMSYRDESSDLPPLMIGAFVEARIQAKPLENVVQVSREHVRANDTVWVMEGGKLSIRRVDIVFQDATHAYVRSGLSHGDRIVTTQLSTVIDGAPLRLRGEDAQASADTSGGPAE